MKLETALLLGIAGFAVYRMKKKMDAAKVANAQAAAGAAQQAQIAAAAPIMDTTNTVTSIQRTVNDPGTSSDNPTLGDQSYAAAGSSGTTSGWGRGYGYARSNWGQYQ